MRNVAILAVVAALASGCSDAAAPATAPAAAPDPWATAAVEEIPMFFGEPTMQKRLSNAFDVLLFAEPSNSRYEYVAPAVLGTAVQLNISVSAAGTGEYDSGFVTVRWRFDRASTLSFTCTSTELSVPPNDEQKKKLREWLDTQLRPALVKLIDGILADEAK